MLGQFPGNNKKNTIILCISPQKLKYFGNTLGCGSRGVGTYYGFMKKSDLKGILAVQAQ